MLKKTKKPAKTCNQASVTPLGGCGASVTGLASASHLVERSVSAVLCSIASGFDGEVGFCSCDFGKESDSASWPDVVVTLTTSGELIHRWRYNVYRLGSLKKAGG